MNYQETLDYLYSQLPMFQRLGKAAYKADLSNTIALCKALGNPERKFKAIHIAGTNGKGSVAHYLASIFQEAGYKTGLFTSPHYLDFRERVKINGSKIKKAKVTAFVKKNRSVFEQIQPSFFEMTAGMAFHHFAQEKVDIAIIETGMGGRLDSTNVVQPILSIITNIGKDHQQFLGNTLKEIAGEKAGIIKEGVPVLIGERQKNIQEVFLQKAKGKNAPIHFADKQAITLKNPSLAKNGNKMMLMLEAYVDRHLLQTYESGLLGAYQVKNIATTLAAMELINETEFSLEQAQIKRGLKKVVRNTGILGRWQTLSENPLMICDAAHNEDGLKQIIRQMEQTPHEKLHIVFGTVKDKKIDRILSLLPKKAIYYFCKSSVPRALAVEDLFAKAKKKKLKGKPFPDVPSAIEAAKKTAGKKDLIFIGGSSFVVADALKAPISTDDGASGP